jgi:hypothetical protein
MTDPTILSGVSNLLTEDPISFSLDILPRNTLHRWLQNNKHTSKYFPKIKEYSIKPITYGNMHRIAALWNTIGLDNIDKESVNKIGLEILEKHKDLVANIIAIAIANSRKGPSKYLVDEMYWNLSAIESIQLLAIVHKQMHIQNFLSTIILIRGIAQPVSGAKQDA